MSDEAVTLGQHINTFITTLSNYTSDWQVMVSTPIMDAIILVF